MFSTHLCSRRWSKSEAIDKMPVGKKTQRRRAGETAMANGLPHKGKETLFSSTDSTT